jgi:hypothetical protein
MERLKPHHHQLLQRIVEAGGLPLDEVDGRVVRPLIAARLVKADDDRVTPTRAGRSAVAEATHSTAATPWQGKLSPAQEDLLRLILNQPGLATDEVDLRTARALRSRGLVRESDGRLTGTAAGAAYVGAPEPAYTARKRGRRPRRHPRAEAILKAVDQLEHALPPGAEVLVGTIMCAAVDVAAGFRKHARKLKDATGE